MALTENGKYEEAMATLIKLKDYRDSVALKEEIVSKNPSFKIFTANIGDSVVYGKYYKTNSQTKEICKS